MRKSRLSKSKQDHLIEHFVVGTTARCEADLVSVNFKTAAYYYHRLRELICMTTKDETAFTGEIELDESYFGGTRKGKRGRGAAGKVPVFASSNVAARSTHRSFQMQRAKLSCPSFRKKSSPIALSMQITGGGTTFWMCQSSSTIG